MTTSTTRTGYIEDLDPRRLHVHPRNARRDLGDLTGLTASIKAMGVLEPLVVVPVVDGHMVIAGHRRRAAAEKAGVATVQCLVRDDLMVVEAIDEAEHIAAMLAENVHRQDLTAVEEATAVQEMLDLGVPVTKVAARTGLTKAHVTRAAALAGVDKGTADMVDNLGLTLEQASVVVEYADDPETSARLAAAALQGASNFTHAVGRAKQDRSNREQLVSMRTQLEAEGRATVDSATWHGPTNRRVTSLYPSEGDRVLGREEHLSCPGSAVHLSMEFTGPVATEVCTDWAANGHRTSLTPGPVEQSPEELEAERVRLEQEREDDAAMAAANAVRRQWIRDQLLARPRADKTVLRYAIEAVQQHAEALAIWLDDDGIDKVCEALGLRPPNAHKYERSDEPHAPGLTDGQLVGDARLPLQLLAHVAGAIECGIRDDAHRMKSWDIERGARADLVSWLVFLEGEGYGLADIEKRIIADHAAAADTTHGS